MQALLLPVLVLRRIFNVISTISLSTHCLRPDDAAQRPIEASYLFPWVRSFWRPSLLAAQQTVYPLPEDDLESFTPSPGHKHDQEPSLDIIHRLMAHPALYDPLRTPRYPIVLCHGLYGFDSRGPLMFPSLRMHYWANVLKILRDTLRAEVIVTSVPGTGSILSRSEALDQQLQHKARGRGINFIAHSMGGLDCRYLITHLKPVEYAPLSLTTISTPHRGSPFMDWCAENIGIGKLRKEQQELKRPVEWEALNEWDFPDQSESSYEPAKQPSAESTTVKTKSESSISLSLSSIPSSFTTLLLSTVDSPAYANLTTAYLNDVFNPATPDDPSVKYFSVAGRMDSVSIWHPFWLPKMVVDGTEQKHRGRLRALWEASKELDSRRSLPLWAQDCEWGNDGLVTIQSARWGEFLGIMEGCDHWEMRGARGIEFGVDLPAIPALGLGVSNNSHRSENQDSWSLMDWTRLIGTWKKEDKLAPQTVTAMETRVTGASDKLKLERQRQRDSDDAVVKASTARLSAVVDWLTEQVPPTSIFGSKPKPSEDAKHVAGVKDELPAMSTYLDKEQKQGRRHDLASKVDLERFYIALARKLYDEGL